ncbi:hypothetical protein C2S53_018527 [Perilla frutescens var. hirtella]|uniref:Uncharacterized protein n=1 Tax=Perilla frutescens var. hirtella TaxID=608512 RepID=A0AAD4J4I3_PERFH|nr:hypothetical protein C2S53_018527 [Perilla frutescens var. hirtella]
MGVRNFFWWLMNKYPKTLSEAATGELDNFYIDLSEIIHPCFRADHQLFRPATYDELFSTMFLRIDRLFDFVRPRNLLFIAIDGVASRSKMYQIRDGNFSSATTGDVAREIGEKLREQFEKEGKSILSKEESQGLDSILYTPGTEFMQLLSDKLRTFIYDKVPGEGEHKIMSFIRAQRASPGYDPNTRHCVYGTDTDLIMLALATHEVHFSILREELVGVFKTKVCQFLSVCVLREYLSFDLEIPCSDKYEYDLERIIDDFIFICFFAGNDYLPCMPTLKTNEGCIDLLMHVYKKEFQSFGGYLVDMQKKKYEKNYQDGPRVSHILASYAIVDNVDGVFRNTVELLLKVEDCISSRKYDLLKDDLGRDKVKLGTQGWRERYYKENFSAETPEEIEATRKTMVAEYGKGLCWVLLCYFSGVPSWSWMHPYTSGPLASELKGLSQIKVEFLKGLPLKPFDQLMGVLPPSRAHLLPEAYKEFMIDKNSKLAHFFNRADGPYLIEEEHLLLETKKLEKELKDHEKVRNTETLDLLFVTRSREASHQAVWCSGSRAASNKIKGAVMMSSNIEGIQGVLHVMPENFMVGDDDNKGGYFRNVLCMFYETRQDFRHVPQFLEGVNIPQMTVKKEDVVENILWHEQELYGYGSGSGGNSKRFENRRQKWEDTSESASSGSWRRDGYAIADNKPRQQGGGGTGGLRGSNMDRNCCLMSNNRQRQGGSSFWQSRSGVTYDTNDDWRSNKLSAQNESFSSNAAAHGSKT